jgi:signal transduction histidine kinase
MASYSTGGIEVAVAERGAPPSAAALSRQLVARAGRWLGRSLGRRFVTMSLGLLLVTQLASFLAIDASLRHHAQSALPEQLGMGRRTLDGLVSWRADKFIEGARLLAADYGFREAVLSHDRETIASALSNHGARIGASSVALLDTRLATLAISDGNLEDAASTAAAAARLAATAARTGGASEITVIGGQPRHVVLVPVKAPMLMGWVLVCFPLLDALAESVHQLSSVDLTLLSRTRPDQRWSVALSRLSPAQAEALAGRSWADEPDTHPDADGRARAEPGLTDLQLDGHELAVRALRFTPATDAAAWRPEVVALLSVSVDEAVRPPRALQIALFLTTLLSFLAFGIGSAYTARRITTPLQSLASAAERLGGGDYATPIPGSVRRDEVGELAQAFEQMRISLIAKQEQIVQSEKLASIGQLAAGVAHEINNPIGFVFSNFGSLEDYLARLFRMLAAYRQEEEALAGTPAALRLARLRDEIELDYLREDIPALMSESKDGIRRVRKIVQDLKDFSHVDTRQEWETVNLHAGLDSTLNIVGNEIKYKADVIRDYGALPDVECLPNELNQVFMNLLVNAAHALGDGRGTITVRTRQVTTEAWVEVADSGSGIAPADLKRIFDPFFTTKPVGKGTGLGLSLSYGIIKKHGGRIEVNSELGVGTTFRVCVPLRRVG